MAKDKEAAASEFVDTISGFGAAVSGTTFRRHQFTLNDDEPTLADMAFDVAFPTPPVKAEDKYSHSYASVNTLGEVVGEFSPETKVTVTEVEGPVTPDTPAAAGLAIVRKKVAVEKPAKDAKDAEKPHATPAHAPAHHGHTGK